MINSETTFLVSMKMNVDKLAAGVEKTSLGGDVGGGDHFTFEVNSIPGLRDVMGGLFQIKYPACQKENC